MEVDKYVTVRHAAMMLGLTPKTIKEWVYTGKLRACRPGGGKLLIREDDILAMIERSEIDRAPKRNPLTDWWRAPKK